MVALLCFVCNALCSNLMSLVSICFRLYHTTRVNLILAIPAPYVHLFLRNRLLAKPLYQNTEVLIQGVPYSSFPFRRNPHSITRAVRQVQFQDSYG